MPQVRQFRVTVTWNAGSGQVTVNPDPVPTFSVPSGDDAQIIWSASNGSFPAPSTAFSWKSTPNPGWTPAADGATLVSPVFNPEGAPNWFYNITITDNSGHNHTLDPEIENEHPPTEEEEVKEETKEEKP